VPVPLPYLPSLLLVLAALVLLGLFVVRAVRSLRRFAATRNAFTSRLRDRTGLLRARGAALRFAVRERLPGMRRRQVAARTITEQGGPEQRRG
jgi:hypothetical protein